jgi:LPS export ABC transporter permease LptF/LPS export ABC transporter permease LptG
MRRTSFLISKYLLLAVLPYFLFAWILTGVILFVQQAGRYSDILFNANIPKNLIWQLTLALVPNIIAFTCPMALLIGVIIGLSRMQGDSELIAIRASGVGTWQILKPIVLLGAGLSLFTFLVNLYGVPFAARVVRKVALQTALYKLESPVEPGVFNTEINGYTIYVKDGDVERGTWKNIFVYYENKDNKNSRLITSEQGRIDSKDEISELVLENALVNTISKEPNAEKLISEKVGQIRFTIKSKRSEITERIGKSEESPEELGLNELAALARNKTGREKIEAQILWQRRIIMSLTPLIFAILGAALTLRFNRRGRGFGVFLALTALVIHYLLTLVGEQFARTNQINVVISGLIPLLTSLFFIVLFLQPKKVFPRLDFLSKLPENISGNREGNSKKSEKEIKSNFYINFSTGILDSDIIKNLVKYFFLAYGFLTFIYLIFTAFELWKFAGEIAGGFALLLKYLFYLLPFVYIQLAPSALMIATLATFVIKSRQNEIVTWTAAGRSVYRLLLPCFLLMIFVGFVNWQIQEKVLPGANRIQDELRAQIRGRGVLADTQSRYWMADDNRIYSFEFAQKDAAERAVKNLSIYEFSGDHGALQAIYETPAAVWEKGIIKFSRETRKTIWTNGKMSVNTVPNLEMEQRINPFNNLYEKPNHLNANETKTIAEISDSEIERRNYAVALEKKYSTPFLPFIITLFTAPFALSLSRKGRVVTVGYAVGIWLLFVGLSNIFEQLGLNGYISPTAAIWSPAVFFTLLGVYLLTKVKT